MTTFNMTGGDVLTARLEEIARKLARFGSVRVGFLEGSTYPDGTPVAYVAAINNFGAPAKGIPARPFFTKMIRDKSPGWGAALSALIKQYGYSAQQVLSLLGEGIAGQLREAITDMNDPTNAPTTNLLKQRFPQGGYTFDDVLKAWGDTQDAAAAPAGKPLVWTGQMLASVDYEVNFKDG